MRKWVTIPERVQIAKKAVMFAVGVGPEAFDPSNRRYPAADARYSLVLILIDHLGFMGKSWIYAQAGLSSYNSRASEIERMEDTRIIRNARSLYESMMEDYREGT